MYVWLQCHAASTVRPDRTAPCQQQVRPCWDINRSTIDLSSWAMSRSTIDLSLWAYDTVAAAWTLIKGQPSNAICLAVLHSVPLTPPLP
jgi:hypothetical protein